MKIKWLSNGFYSLKNCHKQFGQAFRPPPFWAMPKFTRFFGGGWFPSVPSSHVLNFDHDFGLDPPFLLIKSKNIKTNYDSLQIANQLSAVLLFLIEDSLLKVSLSVSFMDSHVSQNRANSGFTFKCNNIKSRTSYRLCPGWMYQLGKLWDRTVCAITSECQDLGAFWDGSFSV